MILLLGTWKLLIYRFRRRSVFQNAIAAIFNGAGYCGNRGCKPLLQKCVFMPRAVYTVSQLRQHYLHMKNRRTGKAATPVILI
jgi:hypothetical protein